MNDDELNEIIARSDEEQKIFAEMDGTFYPSFRSSAFHCPDW